jgi:hypothetical protein
VTTRTWYRVGLARPGAPPVLVAASGEHLGQAIAVARSHVGEGWPIAIASATSDTIPLGESVDRHHVVSLGAPADDVPTFRWPTGVLPELSTAPMLAAVRRGWTPRAHPSLLVIEAQTDADHLVDLFLGLVERLPAADNLEVRVLDHFEAAGTTDVWLTSRVNAKKILRFLDDHDDELFGNGHLELSVYVRAHKATLRLTEHKTVVWLADDRALEADLARWLRELDVPRVDSLVTVYDAPHFHYRPANSRDRKKLATELYRQRLRKVDIVKPQLGPRETDG